MKFKVIRGHYGDKEYKPGDERDANPADVAHLVPHVLKPIASKADPDAKANAKAAQPVVNKAAEPLMNKAVK